MSSHFWRERATSEIDQCYDDLVEYSGLGGSERHYLEQAVALDLAGKPIRALSKIRLFRTALAMRHSDPSQYAANTRGIEELRAQLGLGTA